MYKRTTFANVSIQCIAYLEHFWSHKIRKIDVLELQVHSEGFGDQQDCPARRASGLEIELGRHLRGENEDWRLSWTGMWAPRAVGFLWESFHCLYRGAPGDDAPVIGFRASRCWDQGLFLENCGKRAKIMKRSRFYYVFISFTCMYC